jgi:hypothetical protein
LWRCFVLSPCADLPEARSERGRADKGSLDLPLWQARPMDHLKVELVGDEIQETKRRPSCSLTGKSSTSRS